MNRAIVGLAIVGACLGIARVAECADTAAGQAIYLKKCATCHNESGKRIRLQGLPHLSDPKEAKEVVGQWPAYRVSTTQVMTMQHRLYDCYWQMRMPRLAMGSDVSVALIGSVPGLKRRMSVCHGMPADNSATPGSTNLLLPVSLMFTGVTSSESFVLLSSTEA